MYLLKNKAVCCKVQTHFRSFLLARFIKEVLGALSPFLHPKTKLFPVKFRRISEVFTLRGLLTLWKLAYDVFWLRFQPKNSSFRLPYQRPSSPADCTRELFKGSNRSSNLVDSTRKKCFGWEMRIFCDWHHTWSCFGVILAHVAWPRAQPLGQHVSLKFSLETRLKSESFEPLIDFLAFLVQNLRSKINKLID